MKIAVIGSHGTGKTTLAKRISGILEFNFIPDVAREAHEKKFAINEQTPPETQFWILSKQIELERNTEAPWISEKSLLDNLVYGTFSIKDEEVLRVLEKIILRNLDYDLIFYLPIEFGLVDDGLRSLDVGFQEEIDRVYRQLLLNKKLKFIELTGGVESRVEQALKYIKAHKKYRELSRQKK
ncbi:MAG: ATP-binding protein [Patescibacteria group bacterium]|nr:ATP-binding protein [Patescibacteria group bacterium]